MIHNVSVLIQNEHIARISDGILIAQLPDRIVIQIDKEYPRRLLGIFPAADSLAQCDHPGALPLNNVLYMRGGQNRDSQIVPGIAKPFQIFHADIRIHRIRPIIQKGLPVCPHQSEIADVITALQNCVKLFQKSSAVFRVIQITGQIFLNILTVRDHRCDILHVINIGIDVLIHLPDDCLGVHGGIFQNRLPCIIQGYHRHDQHRTEKHNGNGRKNRTLNALESTQKSSFRVLFFHFRFSLAYSVGVFPVIFLKDIPK